MEDKLGDYTTGEVKKTMKRIGTELGSKIQSLQNTYASIEHLTKICSALQEDPKEVPHDMGLRKVPISFETPILDQEKMQEDKEYQITIPADASFREAK